ncbi:MAG: hypothetical protein Q8R20_01920 [Nanoarchaeota archaeon]|nr:hypothetical protein [Nanoarchaeota archaeon]
MSFASSHTIGVSKHSDHVALSSPFSLLAESLRLYGQRFFTFLFILGIPALFLFVFAMGIFGMADSEAGRLTPGVLFSPAVFLGVVVFGAVVIFLQIWGGAAILYAVSSDRSEFFWTAYLKSFPKIGSYVWIFIAFYLVALAGFTFLIIPGVFLVVSMSFAFFVFFTDEVKGFGALAESVRYARGNFWGILFRVFFGILLGGAFLVILRFLLSSFLVSPLPSVLLNLFSFFVLFPFGLVYLSRIFMELRSRKPWVREGIVRDQFFILATFIGVIIFIASPFLVARGAPRILPTLRFDVFNIQELFALGFSEKTTSVRSGPDGEDLLLLQSSRDEKRLSDISTLSFVFDSVASKNSSFCSGIREGAFKSTAPSGGGTNWLPIDLAREGIQGPVVTHTPRDPVNTSRYHYAFACSKGKYEINTRLENADNAPKGSADRGSDEGLFEVGTDLFLIP